jgi:phosphatidylinositol kinase/protein kinase (PI-3  family)
VYACRYSFLVKAEKTGDLRKDMRMMELCTVINRLLHEDVAGQQRNLSLRTFAVTPMGDRCGIIEWVPKTTGIRQLVHESYQGVGACVQAERASLSSAKVAGADIDALTRVHYVRV